MAIDEKEKSRKVFRKIRERYVYVKRIALLNEDR